MSVTSVYWRQMCCCCVIPPLQPRRVGRMDSSLCKVCVMRLRRQLSDAVALLTLASLSDDRDHVFKNLLFVEGPWSMLSLNVPLLVVSTQTEGRANASSTVFFSFIVHRKYKLPNVLGYSLCPITSFNFRLFLSAE